MQGQLIVAHFLDGTMAKGMSLDVDHRKPVCHLKTREGETVEVALAAVKALFFVKTETGRPAHQEGREAVPGDSRLVGTRRVAVRFADGEEIVGLMNRFPPLGQVFFMLPIDPQSNNLRILVNRAAVPALEERAA